MLRMMSILCALALFLCGAPDAESAAASTHPSLLDHHEVADEEPATDADAEEEAAEDEEWEVNVPQTAGEPITFEATEGTWLSVDVSPDGETIVFDLLGDIYKIGRAHV